MIINGRSLLALSPIEDMLTSKERANGVSHGLTEAGYDIRIKQRVVFQSDGFEMTAEVSGDGVTKHHRGRFVLASSVDRFTMPDCLVGVVHDKSTLARRGLSVFNTVIEPGFCGGLTLELVYHGNSKLIIPAGCGIAQVLFTRTAQLARYNGKYQNQSSDPQGAIFQ